MRILYTAIKLSITALLMCGFIFPIAMTGMSQILFNKQANGSIIKNSGKAIGSELLGQNFNDPRFFHGRISASNYSTYEEKDKIPNKEGKVAYSGVSSGSDNYAVSNPELIKRVQNDIEVFLMKNPGVKKEDIPTDLLTSSGSGLDPHISPRAAKIQITSISAATGIKEKELEELVNKYLDGRQLGILGEERVNILKVNLEISNKIKG